MQKYKAVYKSNRHITYMCKYHIIWCPKYRRPVLINGVDKKLKQIIVDVCKETGSELLEMEIMFDHVHLLAEIDPQLGAHRFIKKVKGRSSRLLRNEFQFLRSKLPTLWTHSYFIATMGGAPLDIIKQYVERQKYV